jgi:heptosyltransferase-2
MYETILSIPERYLQVGKAVGVRDDGLGLDLFWQEEDEKRAQQILSDHQIPVDKPFISIAPGASFFTKRWPAEYFNNLISHVQNAYGYTCVILGGPHDEPLGAYLAQNSNTISLAGKTTLLESAVIIAKSALMVSNDSGLMHMATAVRTPVVVIFGSSVKELGFYPYKGEYKVLEVEGLDCRPCSHIGKNACPKKHFKCMQDIPPESVFNEVERILKTLI